MTILCKFHSGSELPGTPTCGNNADGFIRIHHTGRLVPLCASCEALFLKTSDKILKIPQMQRALPGAGTFEKVALEVGSEEWLRQSPTTEEMKAKARETVEALHRAHENHHKN
jgi:hypothetical protein